MASGDQFPNRPKGDQGDAPLNTEEKEWAMFAHLAGIALSAIGPLILWRMKKDESRFLDEHAKEAMNFQITLVPLYILGIILASIDAIWFVGIILVVILFIISLIMGIKAGMQANKGENYRYPVALRLVS